MSSLEKFVKWTREKLKLKKPDLEDLETEKDYAERWLSIYIIYFTMFLISLGFSIILTGVWPYLDQLDPKAGKEFMGYVVAANPFAQMLFSPLVGWWSNKLGSIRLPLLTTLTIFAIANAIYSSLELFPDHRKHWMLWSRFLVGVSSANIAACRSYLSAATKISERTNAVSMISLAQVLGFIIGPVLQAVVVPLGSDGFWLINNKLKLNMYTAAGWLNVLFTIINIITFFPFMFKEHRIAAREAMQKQGVKTEKETYKGTKVDQLSAWTLLIAFFVLVFNFMLLETLATSLTMDQFAWTKAEALYYMGIIMSVGSILAIVTFALIGPLCKWFPETKVMIYGGFLFMVLGRAVYIPWGSEPALVYDSPLKFQLLAERDSCEMYNKNITNYINNISVDNSTVEDIKMDVLGYVDNFKNVRFINISHVYDRFHKIGHSIENKRLYFKELAVTECSNVTEFIGCPSSQKWCLTTNGLTLTQFILGFALTTFGYPIGVTLIQTIFSKILGPRPQGVWMGLMTGSGCLSRVLGPVAVTYIYTEFGTTWTFGMTTVMMVVAMIWLFLFEKRLVTEDQQLASTDNKETELEEVNILVEKENAKEASKQNGDVKS